MSKLVPDDPRVEHHDTVLNGRNYHYMALPPPSVRRGTAILLHGFPDSALAWRHQAPVLAELGLRVVMPDLLGFGRTDAPDDPAEYVFRKQAADLAALAGQLAEDGDAGPVVLGGHDWGAAVVYAAARLYPDLFRAAFAICVPYLPPGPRFVPLETLVQTWPQGGYQLQFGGPELEAHLARSPGRVRRFVDAMFCAANEREDGPFFTAERGIDVDKLDRAGPPRFLSPEEADHLAGELGRRPTMRGPFNYYRMHRANHEADREEAVAGPARIHIPALFVQALRDPVATPELCEGVERNFDDLTVRKVDAWHWVMAEAAEELNEILREWVGAQLRGASALL